VELNKALRIVLAIGAFVGLVLIAIVPLVFLLWGLILVVWGMWIFPEVVAPVHFPTLISTIPRVLLLLFISYIFYKIIRWAIGPWVK
jgi:hypothetical protein